MDKHRLEMFNDGVFAIIITIMILEIKVPMGKNFSDLTALFPSFISYALSFIFAGIYCKNNYHLIQSISKVNGTILWANLHFLFWLSLIPISTKWMGENKFTWNRSTWKRNKTCSKKIRSTWRIDILNYFRLNESPEFKHLGQAQK